MTKKKQQDEKSSQPLIVKKIKKADHGHHGGAWKVAYADFVTAMMAFFLLLWLLNATSEEQKEGISNYFDPAQPKISRSESGSGGIMGGLSISKENQMQTITDRPPPSDLAPVYTDKTVSEDEGAQDRTKVDITEASDRALDNEKMRREEARFQETMEKLQETISSSPELRDLSKNLLVDITPEGLRIQIVDQEGEPMFPSGSSRMFEKTDKLMALVAKTIAELPNSISIRGHTDSKPFRGTGDYTNWELSADRANASRRVLIDNGYSAQKIANVVGKADTDHLNKEDRYDAQNRRISIILLRDSDPTVKEGVNTNDKALKSIDEGYRRTRGNIQFP